MAKSKFFSLGVEEEFQIVDPSTMELRSHIEEVIEEGGMVLRESIRREMHKSVVETGTGICENIEQARKEVTDMRSKLAATAARRGMTIASAGTHPFSHWLEQEITEHERYEVLVEELKNVARKNLIFGLHVHVGFPDRENAIHVINAASYFVPHILALSANSPFWLGQDTGFASYRVKVFENFPRTGLPHHFYGLSSYNDYVEMLIKTGCIDNPKKIWWDIRLHPNFDTIEYRMCDAQMTVDETIGITAMLQALTAKLYQLNRSNLTFRIYRRCYLEENRFRGARFGLQGKMIDFSKHAEIHTKDLLYELLEFVQDGVKEVGCEKEIKLVEKMIENGNGAERQRRVFEDTGSLEAVTRMMVRETHEGIGVEPPLEKESPA